ncbi:MAG: helix-turn-helix domain-containing protein [Bacteroidota bacterium]
MDEPINTEFECSDPKIGFGFQLLRMEHVFSYKSSPDRDPFEPHCVNFFTLLLLTEGQMTHEVDFIAYKMVKGDCLFISKEQIHKFDKSPTYKGYILIFTEKFMLQHFSTSAFSKISFLSDFHLNPTLFQDFGDVGILINALKREFSFNLGIIKEDIAAAILTVFLLKAQLRTSHALKSFNGDYRQFLKFRNLVTSNYIQTRKANEYASFLNTTYKQLNALCKSFTRKTVKEYIDNYVVLQAKRLLVMSKLPIKQTAYECGFSEETNFLKFFKKVAGITPAQFREMIA